MFYIDLNVIDWDSERPSDFQHEPNKPKYISMDRDDCIKFDLSPNKKRSILLLSMHWMTYVFLGVDVPIQGICQRNSALVCHFTMLVSAHSPLIHTNGNLNGAQTP